MVDRFLWIEAVLVSEAGKLVCQESAANCYVINTKVSVTEHCHCDVCAHVRGDNR